MTDDNPLKKARKPKAVTSTRTALQWAKLARESGDHHKAALWEKAHRDGWDLEHYQP